MTDVASLIIRVTQTGADAASRSLSSLGKAAVAAGAGIATLATAQKVLSTLVDTQRNVDKLSASLLTLTGSTENAEKAFAILQKFAKDTPFGLNQAVEAFTKLTALGLEPSQRALLSYGNTAAALGKDLNQMIEAVADASTFEFERLKEFGIKSKQEGDKVKFTFQGVTTEVAKNSRAIQDYLLQIGEVQFAGALENRTKTLDGAISSLEDTWQGLIIAFNSSAGFGQTAAAAVKEVEDALVSLTDEITSGALVNDIKGWVDLINDSFRFISDALDDLTTHTKTNSDQINADLTTIPDSIREWLPAIQETANNVIAYFQRIDDYAVALGQSIADVFDPSKTSSRTFNNLTKQAEERYQASIKANAAEAKSITDNAKAAVKASNDKRTAYKKEQEELNKTNLASLSKTPQATESTDTSAADKAAEAAAKKLQAQKDQAQAFLDSVARQNRDEIAAIDANEQQKLAKLNEYNARELISQQSYEKAKTDIILNAGVARQEELDKRAQEQKDKEASADDFLAQIQAENEGELAEIDRQNEAKLKKLEDFHDKGLISEEEYQRGKEAIAKKTDQERIKQYAAVLGQTTDDLRKSLGEGNKLYKAFALTNAIITTYTSAISAFNSAAAIPVVGFIAAPIAAAAAVAAGLANVAKIRSAREQGGNLGAGQISTIAERGKAEVIMPAGASRVRTAEQMRQIMGENNSNRGGDGVTIVNNTSAAIGSARTERDDEGRLRVIIEEQVASSLQDSNSRISKARRSTRGQPGFA